jgi:hypothetical protein
MDNALSALCRAASDAGYMTQEVRFSSSQRLRGKLTSGRKDRGEREEEGAFPLFSLVFSSLVFSFAFS